MSIFPDSKPPDTDIDAAAEYVSGHVEEIDPRDEKRCLHRIDLCLMPVMFLTMSFHHLDQMSLAAGTLFGLLEDLDLAQKTSSGVDVGRYSYCTMIFFCGYAAGTPLAIFLTQKARLGRYVSVSICLWGAVTLTAAVTCSYPGLLAQRFFLGFCQASICPAFSLITAMWYRPHEQPLRITIWLSSFGWTNVVGPLMTCGIAHIQDATKPWKYQYIIFGSATVAWGIAVWFLLPDNPMTAWFLAPRLRKLAIQRVAGDQIWIENKKVKPKQIKEALLDPKTWAYVIVVFCVVLAVSAVSYFGPLLVRGFGYTELRTTLLISGIGAVYFFSLLISGVIAVYARNSRIYLAILCCLPIIAGAATVWKSNWERKIVPLMGVYLLGSFAAPLALTLSLATANTAGHTKKVVVMGMTWAAYCIGSGIAPLLVIEQEKQQHYSTTVIIIISSSSVAVAVLVLLRLYLMRMNYQRELEKEEREEPVDYHEVLLMALMDKTDTENPNFRYQM